MNILSVDFGTSSVKMAILNKNLEVLATTKFEYNYEVIEKFKIQLDAETIFKAFLEGLKSFENYLKKIDVLVFCVFSPCLIAMDKEGRPLYPAIIHLDRRSYPQSKYAIKVVGKNNFLKINGNLPFPGGISCTSILWIKDNCEDIYKKTYKFGHLNTFIHRCLVGKWIIDPSNASFTGLYETLKLNGTWSDDICNALGIDTNKLPDVVPSLSIAGKLSKEAASLTGLREGIPVAVGANDTTSAAYGAGAVEKGDILNISGSSEIVTITTDDPKPHEKYYVRVSMENGKWLYLAITVGGFALEWFRKEFYKEMDKKYFYEVYLPEVLKKNIKTDVKFKPYLAGDRHSLAKKKGAFTGLTFDTTREDFLIGLLIGTYEPVFNAINICKKQMKLNTTIYWTGGMISDAYLEFKKRIFKGFNFDMKKDCTIIGNGKVALKLLC
ncbi:xylulokinase [Caldanaerovirga acetigignens]|uniref:Xylulokinase n=1 Tax=Caldanaerovirga acetigignens TaxID=447595 RepID=A0A1M7HA56_9FIRM|nr:FGGY family carbohydrate kinase [Caldanaerovirga acetigignens]SHM25374.1 xylulokinase [Caldanaerovirga acetigignens]